MLPVSFAAIARVAGVAKSTAARVLKAHQDGVEIDSEEAQRVRAAAETLGWVSQTPHSSLPPRIRRRPIVALLGANNMPIGLGIHSDLIALVHGELDRLGFDLLPISLKDGLAQWRMDRRSEQVVGAILLDYLSVEFDSLLPHLGVPACVYNYPIDYPVDQVLMDDIGGSILGAEYLLRLGHRRIAWVEPALRGTANSIQERRSALHQACSAGGCAFEVIHHPLLLADRLLAPDRPTALVGYTDKEIPGLITAIRSTGLRLPTDLSLLVPGPSGLLDWFDPPVTTIELPIAEMVRCAVDLLCKRIADPQRPIQRSMISQRLLIRGTTAPPP